jgi:hypothetical protein
LIGNYYFYGAIAAAVVIAIIIIAYSLVLIFARELGNNHYQSASAINKAKFNSTSTICINDKPCITTICINNDPCRTVTSNSTNTDHNLTNNNKNHPLVSPFPQESV